MVTLVISPKGHINGEVLTCLTGRVTFTLCPTGRNFSGTVNVSLKLFLSSSLSETFCREQKKMYFTHSRAAVLHCFGDTENKRAVWELAWCNAHYLQPGF